MSQEEKPYVPPMGDLSQVFTKPGPKLMLTNGSSAPGAAIKAARHVVKYLYLSYKFNNFI